MARQTVDPDRVPRSPVALAQVFNFGPVLVAEFEAMGITCFTQIEEMGLEETARLWTEVFPKRCHTLAMLGLVTALDGVKWSDATEAHKRRAKQLSKACKAYLVP